jgi:hypothetical protein
MSDAAAQPAAATQRQVSSSDLLDTLKSEPQFARQLLDPGFDFVVGSHLLLHDIVTKHIPLQRAPTKGDYADQQTLQQHCCLSHWLALSLCCESGHSTVTIQ